MQNRRWWNLFPVKARLFPTALIFFFYTGITQEAQLSLVLQTWVEPFRGAQRVTESDWIRIAPGVIPIWSPDSRSLYYARYSEGSADAGVVMRQPIDDTGHPAGPATEFYRFDGTLDDPVVNTPVASRSYLYTLQRTGMSETWLMDFPQ